MDLTAPSTQKGRIFGQSTFEERLYIVPNMNPPELSDALCHCVFFLTLLSWPQLAQTHHLTLTQVTEVIKDWGLTCVGSYRSHPAYYDQPNALDVLAQATAQVGAALARVCSRICLLSTWCIWVVAGKSQSVVPDVRTQLKMELTAPFCVVMTTGESAHCGRRGAVRVRHHLPL